MFKNFKTKLIITISIFLIIPMFLIGINSYFIARDSLEEEMKNSASEQLEIIDKTIDSVISLKIHDIETISKNISADDYRRENQPLLRDKLKLYADLHPETQRVYVGTPAGLFIVEPKFEFGKVYDPRKYEWFTKAMENEGEIILSSPYVSPGSGEMVVTVSKTTGDGKGVVGIDIYLSYLQELIGDISIGTNGYVMLLDENGNFIVHYNHELLGKKGEDAYFEKIYNGTAGQVNHTEGGEEQTSVFITNDLTDWKIVGNIFVSEMDAKVSSILKSTLIAIFILFIIGAIISYVLIKSIIRPIRKLNEKAIIISQGDLTEGVDVDSNDEIGQLGSAFNEMQNSLKTLVKEVDGHAEHVAASAEQLTASAEQTSSATEQVATSIQQVAAGAEQQNAKIEANADAITKVSKGTNEIAEKSLKVAELSNETIVFAENGGQAVESTLAQMKSIQQSVNESNSKIQTLFERSNEVKSILDVISGIAEQTNLLSLNAAIEAARAGEHGKGFAVVANEVRHLAEESQKSSQKITEIIFGIQEDTNISVKSMEKVMEDVSKGVMISNEASEKFAQILRSTTEITKQIDEISSIAQQITVDVKVVTENADEISDIAQANVTASEEVAASSEQQLAAMEEITASAKQLANNATELKELLAKFKY